MASIRKKTRDGGESYEVRIHRAGVPAMSKSFRTLAEAREWANRIESKIDRGERVNRKAATVLMTEACADFLEHFRPRNKSGKITPGQTQLVQAIARDFEEFSISQITHDVIQKWMDLMLKTKISAPEKRKKFHPYYNGKKERTYSASTVRKHYFALKQILEWHSIREKYSLDESLFRNQAIPPSWSGRRKRRLEEGELEKLKEAAIRGYSLKEELPLIIDFAIATAARAQEILKAKWSDVNSKGRAWNIPPENVKTSTFRQVPLSKKSLEILEKMKKFKREDEEKIFWMWKDSSTLSKSFRRLCHRAGIENLRFHDLRHEATSRIFETTNLSDAEIMSITGHTNIQTLIGYAHLRASHLAAQLDSI